MVYPVGVSVATAKIGTSIDLAGDPVSLSARVTLVLGGNAKRITHQESGTTWVAGSRVYQDDGTGIVTFTVPHVDQAGFVDGAGNAVTMWAYHVKVTARMSDRSTQEWDTPFQPVMGQTDIDLDLVRDGSITAPVSAPVPAVTSVNGKTGAVTVEAPDVDLSGYATTTALSTGLSTKVSNTTYTALANRVTALEDAPAGEPYDDTALAARVTELEQATAPEYELVESPAGSGLYVIQQKAV